MTPTGFCYVHAPGRYMVIVSEYKFVYKCCRSVIEMWGETLQKCNRNVGKIQ